VLRRLQGETVAGHARPAVTARLQSEVVSRPGREDYLRVRLQTRDGELQAAPLPTPNSLATLIQSDGLVVVPESTEKLSPGTLVQVHVV
jgi:molybdopterin molybdotransferase